MSNRTCEDCGRPLGEDMEKPVAGHCYGAWFIDWQSTDCWRIASARYVRPVDSEEEKADG